ncbi:hypothetical protein CTAYLR_001485 [Chrysophaeum taylorii]|uniref:FYVE-type domain-containing protein n=1 Tax=Chrysophaeum taylorii TaxID=2483200 RepID=A0AAD7UD87_9STRA|nr:hypothetical protein CTAYLR_001485 [Chrysophaeum taylorii]
MPSSSLFEGGGFDDIAPPARVAQGIRPTPPEWIPDARVTTCMAPACSVAFDTFERRHHCRYCGQIYCERCSSRSMLMPPVWEGKVQFATRDPQRVCDACAFTLERFQKAWSDGNANANRTNVIALDDYSTRYLNSPLRFTLGGEVRKAAYSLRNLLDGINYWDRDAEYFDRQLAGANGLLFLTVGKIAFIGGVRVGTGLVVARLPDSSWSAPCAVGSFGFTFGAVVGAEVTDFVTPLDAEAISEFCNNQTSKVAMGGEVSFAFGPLGRTASAEGIVASDASTTSATSYAQSRGFYGGITVEGAYIKVRDDVNLKFYGRPLSASDLLSGVEKQPTAAAPLYDQLNIFYAEMDHRLAQAQAAAAYGAPEPNSDYNRRVPYDSQYPPANPPKANYESFATPQSPPQRRQQQQQQQQQQVGGIGDSLWGSKPVPKNPFDGGGFGGDNNNNIGRDVVEV